MFAKKQGVITLQFITQPQRKQGRKKRTEYRKNERKLKMKYEILEIRAFLLLLFFLFFIIA